MRRKPADFVLQSMFSQTVRTLVLLAVQKHRVGFYGSREEHTTSGQLEYVHFLIGERITRAL